MSTAHKCDRCGSMYEMAPADITLDVHTSTDPLDDKFSTETVELCTPCSVEFRKFLHE